MPTAPKVSVIMSVWNNGPYVAKTIDSILAQTFDNFEFIIMDDRGGDNTVEIIRSYNDPRIKLHTNPENMGIARSLNSAISKATGEYIAVMDGDDIAEPERLAQQVAYMDAHPDTGILGTSAYEITSADALICSRRQPISDDAIRFQGLFLAPFYHPSIMYRASIIREHQLEYDGAFKSSLDYHFWCAVMRHCKHAANLPEPLIRYRIHAQSSSVQNKALQTDEKRMTALDNLQRLDPQKFDRPTYTQLCDILQRRPAATHDSVVCVTRYLPILAETLAHQSGKQRPCLEVKAIAGRWMLKTLMPGRPLGFRLKQLLYIILRRPDYVLAYALTLPGLALWRFQSRLKWKQ